MPSSNELFGRLHGHPPPHFKRIRLDRPIQLAIERMEACGSRGKNAANRIHVIELRSDDKYGSFIRHEPARAQVKIVRSNGKLGVSIDEFVSPSIVERLRQQAGILQPKIDDWRAMVDCVMIDPAYDGHVFNVALSDIPERKSDLVKGTYELPAPPSTTPVAVKVVDMLGEEILVTAAV